MPMILIWISLNGVISTTRLRQWRRDFMYAPFQNIFPLLPERLLSAIRRQQSKSRMRLVVNDNQMCFADLIRAGSLLILDSGYEQEIRSLQFLCGSSTTLSSEPTN